MSTKIILVFQACLWTGATEIFPGQTDTDLSILLRVRIVRTQGTKDEHHQGSKPVTKPNSQVSFFSKDFVSYLSNVFKRFEH